MRTKDFDENEILRKAITIFWQKGYNATSLYDLIEGLGIGRSSIYHSFGDKHNLYLKALDLYQREATARITAILNSGPSVKEAVAKLLQTIISEIVADEHSKGCFKVNSEVELAPHDEATKKILCDDNAIIEDALYQAFLKGQKDKSISASKDPQALTRFICNTVAGMRVYAKFRSDRPFFEDIAETALSALD
ncbi:TetR/AcrR family transcriptional regulator [Chitinophaga pinensis]|uniref:Transcriptional regulator, TetR family n=1 Tax=Chitinophaga pinensis (strain ATCC 43595 / DSM 2588 / LMG 13176 / NBRC 15968 / NCIMB 11800 / UQM 2034) TaxID=485918 RepID=A0A979G6S3_CHIPD|nr:TetR/AcrR family transcriptional regulator [Chitinophaga pinensis]ACU61751.1 transcriptional regulator, TetR family [Chitinophaga pinensis DSM 2588]